VRLPPIPINGHYVELAGHEPGADAGGDSGNRLRSIAVRNKKPPACAGGSCSCSRVQLTG